MRNVLLVLPVLLLASSAAAETRPAQVALTEATVAARAIRSSREVAVAAAEVRAAAAEVSTAKEAYVPRVTLEGRYTRLSDFTAPPLFSSDGRLVGTTAPAGTLNPAPTVAVALGDTRFPVIVDNWFLQAQLAVPISDYFLRIQGGVRAANAGKDAAEYAATEARGRAVLGALGAYYTWHRALRVQSLARLAVEDQKAHLADAEKLLAEGLGREVDVLRARTGLANARATESESARGVAMSEARLGIALDLRDASFVSDEVFELPPTPASLERLLTEAYEKRPELARLRALDAQAHAAESIAEQGRFPTLVGVANATLANPNPRRIPQSNEWFPTWDASVVVRWNLDEIITGTSKAKAFHEKRGAIQENLLRLRDGIRLEIMDARTELETARVHASANEEALSAATEAHRLARIGFREGKASGATVLDAETDLMRARVGELETRVAAKLSAVRLAYAVGRLAAESDRSAKP
ncbi:MAG: TolC family protein [Polyangiaceae bacterium]